MKKVVIFFGLLSMSCASDVATDYDGSETTSIGGALSLDDVEHLVEVYNSDVEVFEIPESFNNFSDPTVLFMEDLKGGNLNNLKANVLKNALFLVNKTNFDYYDNNGLAYVWGSKNSSIKIRPSEYRKKPNICSEKLYGLDCSGFIYEILKNSDLILPKKPRNYANAEWFSKAKNWKDPLDNYLNCINCYRVYNADKNLIKSGDIIYFKVGERVYHIGIVFKYNNELLLFESVGNPKKKCIENIKMGPRIIILTEKFLKNKSYEILRFEEIKKD